MKIAVCLATVGLVATGLNAAPIYVGETLKPKNNITLNFQDTMSKKDVNAATPRNETGNIAAFELRGAYNVNENIPVTLGLPFYMASKKALGSTSSRNALGNVGLGLGWVDTMATADREMTWGYDLRLNSFLPTSRKDEAGVVASANPSIDLYRYSTKATTIQPQVGLFVTADQFSGKVNSGLGYTYIQDATDTNRLSLTGQLAGSWHAMPNMHVNLEYNAIYAEKSTFGSDKYRHALAPSISGNFDQIIGSAFVNVPLDSVTRDYHNLAFGINAGYTF
jgi:hypothetical protein